MLVLSLGVPRSASTWLYNALYGVLALDGAVARGFAETMEQTKALSDMGARHIVIKSHLPTQHLLEHAQSEGAIVASIRDPRDSVASMLLTFGGDPVQRTREVSGAFAAITHCFGEARELIWRYEDRFADAVMGTLTALAARLRIRLRPSDLDQLAQFLSRDAISKSIRALDSAPQEHLRRNGADVLHVQTHWHRNHLGDGRSGKWRALDRTTRNLVESALAPFADEWGYEPSGPAAWAPEFFAYDVALPVDLSSTGFIFHGPYMYLPRGAWSLTAQLHHAGPPAIVTFDIACAGHAVTTACVEVTGDLKLTLDFSHQNTLLPIEFRAQNMCATPGARLTIDPVAITRAA